MTKIVEMKVRQASPAPEPSPSQPEAISGNREGRWRVVALSLSCQHLSCLSRQRHFPRTPILGERQVSDEKMRP